MGLGWGWPFIRWMCLCLRVGGWTKPLREGLPASSGTSWARWEYSDRGVLLKIFRLHFLLNVKLYRSGVPVSDVLLSPSWSAPGKVRAVTSVRKGFSKASLEPEAY